MSVAGFIVLLLILASLGALGNHLNRTDPSFDARNYGFGKLSDLVKTQPFVETKTVTAPGGRGNLRVRLKGRRPVEEASTRLSARCTFAELCPD